MRGGWLCEFATNRENVICMVLRRSDVIVYGLVGLVGEWLSRSEEGLGWRSLQSRRSNLGCNRPLALQLALVPLECLLPAVLEITALMVFREPVLQDG